MGNWEELISSIFTFKIFGIKTENIHKGELSDCLKPACKNFLAGHIPPQ